MVLEWFVWDFGEVLVSEIIGNHKRWTLTFDHGRPSTSAIPKLVDHWKLNIPSKDIHQPALASFSLHTWIDQTILQGTDKRLAWPKYYPTPSSSNFSPPPPPPPPPDSTLPREGGAWKKRQREGERDRKKEGESLVCGILHVAQWYSTVDLLNYIGQAFDQSKSSTVWSYAYSTTTSCRSYVHVLHVEAMYASQACVVKEI